ncbi:hypothetical protein MYK68_15875 [Gordonia sp. PP30]|uniref:hypothetical protein n=1 Tax=Gordonia sp. PP30 TaxID=2935861 RepID=UPI0020002DD6|nr:hypothetical protein [Gordonia sp. PP30]UQE74189.1 hypothetical protein MYK68_15875 [Gordonia sp. PP30]
MTLVVGTLMARLGLDDSGFKQGMNGARQEFQASGKSAAQMAAQVEKSAAKVQSARAAEQAAAVRVRAAEENLTKVRQTAKAGSLELAQAEAKLQSALASQNSAKVRATQATQSLSSAQRQQAAAAAQSSAATQKATASTNQLASAATKARGTLAAMGVGFGIAAVVKGMTDAVGAARALGAQTNQMNVVFGSGRGQIEAWGKSAVDTMRMSQREAQGAAIQFAVFGKAMGLSGQQLVNFSKEQTKLAADLASFQGIPIADAIQAMGSAYAGETETMRQYGVLLDEASVKEAVYTAGIAARGTELTAQQKAIGTYLVMQKQLAHVNGDVERSNGKFGASLKTLTARFEETQAAVGGKLIPVVQPFVDLLAGPGLNAIEGTAGAIGKAAAAFNSLPGPVKAALAAIVAYHIAQKVAGDQMAGLGAKVSGVGRSFTQLGQTVNVQTAQGTVAMGRFGSAIGNIGRQVPIIARMQTAFVQAAAGADRFPRSAGTAAAAMTGMRGAATGLMGALGGPWGMAITGATALLTMWIQKKSEDKAKSEEAKAATQEWADALLESGGAINANLRQMASKKIADTGAYEAAEKLGISQQELTEKVLQGREAYDLWFATIQKKYGDGNGHDSQLAALTGDVQKLATTVDDGRSKAEQMAKANGDMSVSFDKSSAGAGTMSKAMAEFEESTDGAASKVDKLAKALSSLQDDKLTQEEALQQWSDGMRDLAKSFDEAGAASVKLDGHIDVTTEKGSKLQDQLVSQGQAYSRTAASALEYARAQHMGPAAALDYVTGQLVAQRKAFIDQAVAAGVSADTAKKMADVYLGVPSEIATNVQLRGADAAIEKMGQLKIAGAQKLTAQYTVVADTAQARKKLDEMKVNYKTIDGQLVIDQKDVDRAKKALKELGIETTSLPPGYVEVTDTSAENMDRLKKLGIEVKTLPGGVIVVDANDAAFWDKVNRAQQPGEKKILITPEINYAANSAAVAALTGNPALSAIAGAGSANADGSIRAYADGAVRRPAGVPSLPSEAVIEPAGGSGLVRWAEAGAGAWEAFIPGKKTPRTIAILRESARRLGYMIAPYARAYAKGAVVDSSYGLPPGGGGPFPDWVHSLESQYGVKASTYAGHQESDRHEPGYAPNPNHLNRGIDWSGSVDHMQRFAEHLLSIAPSNPGVEQIIWQNPNTGQKIGWHGRSPDTDGSYFASDYPGHTNHVHLRASSDITGAGGVAAGGGVKDVTLTRDSSREDVARKIIAEGRKRGYTDDQIRAVLATADQESGLKPDAVGGGGQWHGIFQQSSAYPGRDDPNTNITGFYDKLDANDGKTGDIWEKIVGVQQHGGAYQGTAGDQRYMGEIKSKEDSASKLLADLGPGVGTGDQGGLGTGGSGSGAPVYVTNWPSNYGGSVPSTTGAGGGGSTGSDSGSGGGTRRLLFTLGGGSIYNGNPDQPSTGGGTGGGKTTTPKASTAAQAKAAVEKARRDQAAAAEKERIAEMKLDEVRANPKAKPSQIAAAELAVQRAKDANTTATDRLRIAELRLQELQGGTKSKPAGPTVKRQSGGTIPGSGRGDIVPMMGEPGEEVIRRSVASRPGIRAFLKRLNATGQVPEFHADGGTVGGFGSGFGGYQAPAVAKVGLLDHKPAYWLEQMYRLGVAGYGGAAMAASAIGTDGSFQGFSTGSSSFPILDDIAKKLDEVIKEGRVGSIGIYVGDGGQIVVEDMGKLRKSQDDAVRDAMMRSGAMRT